MGRFKTIIRPIIFVLITILLLLILLFSVVIFMGNSLDMDYMHEKEFSVYYENNKADLDYIGNELLKVSEDTNDETEYYGVIEKSLTPIFFLKIKGEDFDYIGENFMFYPYETLKSNYNVEHLKDKSFLIKLDKFIDEGDIEYICVYKHHISFYVGGPHVEYIYSKVGPPFPTNHFYEYIQIADNWYYLWSD